MTQVTLDTSKGQLVAYAFGQDAVAASQDNVQIPAVGPEEGGTTAGYTMPFKGDIVAIAVELTAAGSAGTLTVGATADGTEDADTTMTITTGTGHYKRIPRGKARIAAGAELGCEITSDGSWNGTTADMNAVVYVLHYLEGI
ncbi:MAG: hypothetical protein MOGMAGMI_01875 [Candidatus Omnitrophica bacterium]|nr:hypothetical protein [Candidatus Omnitrophota bacterium]